jgi:hypothetical protein
MNRALLLGAVLLVLAAGCSPEASRTRGGGPGADVGNRDYPLPELHGRSPESNPSYQTPKIGRAIEK